MSLKTDVIKHRNRSKGKGKDKKATNAPVSNQDALASSRGSNGRPGSLERRKSDSDVDMSSDERSEAFDRNSGKRQKRDDQPEAPNNQAQMDYLAAIASHQHQRNIQQSTSNPWTAPYGPSAVPSGRRSPNSQPGSRSASLDARADHLHGLSNRGTLAGRSPSQPAYPHSHQPLYPSGLQHSHSPYANYYPHMGTKDQKQTFPTDSSARYSPSQDQNGDRRLVLPSLSSLTQHLREDEGPYQADLARGRQRDRIVLPPIQALPDAQQFPSFPQDRQQAQRPSPNHIFGQHRSNDACPLQLPDRPNSSSSGSSSSNNATGLSPFSQHSVLPNIAHSPALLPVAEHPDTQLVDSSRERRGRSITRKPAMGDAQMLDHSLEAVRIASRSNSRSNSPSPAWNTHESSYGAAQQSRQQNYTHFRSSSARGRPADNFSNIRGSAREDSVLGKHGRSSSERAAPSGDDADDVEKLRTRIAELELINSLLTSRVKQLEGNATKPPVVPAPAKQDQMYEA